MSTTYHKGCSLKEAIYTAAQTGTPCMALTFDVPEVGTRTVFLYYSSGAAEYSDEKLRKLGFNGKADAPEFSNAGDVELSCKIEQYEGKDRDKWDIAGGMVFEPAGQDVVRQFNARWKAKYGSAPSKPSAPSKAPPKAPSKAPEKDPGLKATTKDEAWEATVQLNPGVDEKVVSERFYASIEKIGKEAGREEDEFTAADWQKVADDGIPF